MNYTHIAPSLNISFNSLKQFIRIKLLNKVFKTISDVIFILYDGKNGSNVCNMQRISNFKTKVTSLRKYVHIYLTALNTRKMTLNFAESFGEKRRNLLFQMWRGTAETTGQIVHNTLLIETVYYVASYLGF